MIDPRNRLLSVAIAFALAAVAVVALPFVLAMVYVGGQYFAAVLGWS